MGEPRILVACSPGERRIAVITKDTLTDYAIWRPGHPDGVGDVHRGRIIAHARHLGGSFVALAGEPVEGFLPDSETLARPLSGQLLTVAVTRAAQAGKGPRLTARLPDADQTQDGPVRLLRRGPSPIDRFAAQHPSATITIDDAGVLARLHPVYGNRLQRSTQAFPPALEDQLDALHADSIAIPGGGRLRVQPTAALTAIDVDLGTATASGSKTAAHSVFNQALMPFLARQIRLRSLSGAILVDVAGLSSRRRAALGPALQSALATDPIQTRLVGFTGLGLAEIVRRRIHPPLHELRSGAWASLTTALRVAVAEQHTTSVLHAAPDLLQAWDQDPIMREDLARSTAHALILRSDPTQPPGTWRLA